jgi:hypothetical protein
MPSWADVFPSRGPLSWAEKVPFRITLLSVVADIRPFWVAGSLNSGRLCGGQFVTKNSLFQGCFSGMQKRKSKAAKGL